MTDLTVRTLNALAKSISQDTVAALRGKLRGVVALPGEDGYDEARTIWNAMIDRRPALIVRCLGAADVRMRSPSRATNNLLVAVRGGGHNIAGNAVCDDGLLIDLSLMKSVRRRSRGATRARRARRHARGLRRRDAGVRARHAARHQLDHRRRRPHARRRLRLAHPQVRPDRRQSDLGRRRHGRRHAGPRERDGAPGSVLGDCAAAAAISASSPVRVRAASGRPEVLCRPGRASARRRRRKLLPQLPRSARRGARRAHVLGGDAQGAAAAVPARGMARQGGSSSSRSATPATSKEGEQAVEGLRAFGTPVGEHRRPACRSPPGSRHSIRC